MTPRGFAGAVRVVQEGCPAEEGARRRDERVTWGVHFASPDAMSRLFRLDNTVRRDPDIEAWMQGHGEPLGGIARHWFECLRASGDDVREVLHDGHPTACIGDAAFAYVNAFRAHVNLGFFRGAELVDPAGLLEGTGKFMRHVKLRADTEVDARALSGLIAAAYADMKERLKASSGP